MALTLITQQSVTLWESVSEVNLNPDVPETIRWKFTSDGAYSATKSVYKMQYEIMKASYPLS
jgi:hypothetical protein